MVKWRAISTRMSASAPVLALSKCVFFLVVTIDLGSQLTDAIFNFMLPLADLFHTKPFLSSNSEGASFHSHQMLIQAN